MTTLARILCSGGLLALLVAPAGAAAYPDKSIRLVVPFPAGGSTDIVARIVGQKLGERLGQQVVVDNRGGAGGTIGTAIAARSSPDGYSLMMGSTSTHVVAPSVYRKLAYDPAKDFAPISLVAVTPYLLVVNPSVPAKSLGEFIALVKGKAGQLNYASAGAGTTTHLAMEMLKSMAGLNVVHVPYNGNGPAEIAVVGGQVQALFGSMPALLQAAKAGRIRPLAVGSAKRSESLPDIPTAAEAGVPGYEASLWLGFFAPSGTAKGVIARLHQELARIVATPEMKDQLMRNGAEAISNDPDAFAKMIRADIVKYAKVVKDAGVKVE